MPNHDLSSHHFQQKISEFCEVRIAPIVSKRVLENIRPYLKSLIISRKSPPILNSRIDWMTLAEACGIEDQLTTELKKQLRPGLDAIIRWLRMPPVAEDVRSRTRDSQSSEVEVRGTVRVASSCPKPIRNGNRSCSQSVSATRGPQPKPVEPFPDPLSDAVEDPAGFRDALVYHMRRFGDTYWQLHRAVIRLGETFDDKTLLSWIQGERVPRSVASFEILSRIEQRYRLAAGYFKAKLPHQSRSLYGHEMGDISSAERRRIVLHLPDDFSSLPFAKREEILDWVRRVIISGATDYRRYQAAAIKQRYAIRFPGITYGGGALSPRILTPAGTATRDATETLDDL